MSAARHEVSPMQRRWKSLGLTVSAVLALSFAARAEDGTSQVGPKTYGTSQDSIYHVPITDIVPLYSTFETTDGGFLPHSLARYSPGCTGGCLFAVPALPNGAFLTAIEAYFCNTDPDHNRALGVRVYSTSYDGTNFTDLGAGVYSSDSFGCGEFEIAELTSLNYTVNRYNNQLVLGVVIDDDDGSQAIAGIDLFYRLQVSPAPGTADFNDVPTSHPFFQFVEALYASGITGGCGNGNFCPDAPLTRGQMAVFLAILLIGYFYAWKRKVLTWV